MTALWRFNSLIKENIGSNFFKEWYLIKFLSSLVLAFPGDYELLRTQHYGNYLGILELLGEYSFVSSHFARYGNVSKEKPSYFSSTICEEIIEIMRDTVLQDVVNEILKVKYFSISVDLTSDISHTD